MLNQDEKNSRQQKLNDVLSLLSASQNIFSNEHNYSLYIDQLKKIYCTDEKEVHFRHLYSDIFGTLTDIDSEENPDKSLDVLGQNIRCLRDYYCKNESQKNDDDIGKELEKLYDHVNLEIARINYNKALERRFTSETEELKTLITKTTEDANKTRSSIESSTNDIRKSQQNLQKEYVTILGIFAAIILAFTGTMTFSGSVLNNINKGSLSRLVIITSVIGIVFFNIIWVLLDFISRINGKEVAAPKSKVFWFVNVFLLVLLFVFIIVIPLLARHFPYFFRILLS